MQAAELLEILRKIATRHEDNKEDEDGDIFLSNSEQFSQVMCDLLLTDGRESEFIQYARHDGWLDNE